MKSRTTWLIVAAGLAAVVALLLVEDLGAAFLNRLLLHLPGVDKVLHFAQSAVLFALMWLLLRRAPIGSTTALLVAAAGAIAAAVFDEVLQGWVGARNVELADIAASAAGAMASLGLLARRRAARLATVAIAAGIVAASGLTYTSYLRTRDYNRGLLAERDGRLGDARQHYQAAVDSGVQNPELFNALAWAMTESGEGDPHDAVAYAEQSLAMRPGNADTLDTYGWALYRAGRAGDAVTPLQQALESKPGVYCIHYHLGMVYLDLGRRDQGRHHLQQQIDLMPGTREARLAADVLTRLEISRYTQ